MNTRPDSVERASNFTCTHGFSGGKCQNAFLYWWVLGMSLLVLINVVQGCLTHYWD